MLTLDLEGGGRAMGINRYVYGVPRILVMRLIILDTSPTFACFTLPHSCFIAPSHEFSLEMDHFPA